MSFKPYFDISAGKMIESREEMIKLEKEFEAKGYQRINSNELMKENSKFEKYKKIHKDRVETKRIERLLERNGFI